MLVPTLLKTAYVKTRSLVGMEKWSSSINYSGVEKKYYLLKGTESMGPYTLHEIHAFNLPGDTLVWYEGMGPWKKYRDVPDLWKGRVRRELPPIVWYAGIVLIMLAAGWYLLTGKKDNSPKLVDAYAANFTDKMMRDCNRTSGKNPRHVVLGWDYDKSSRRYAIEMESYWDGQPNRGPFCEHMIRVLLNIDADGSDQTYKVLGTNQCLDIDAKTDYKIRDILER